SDLVADGITLAILGVLGDRARIFGPRKAGINRQLNDVPSDGLEIAGLTNDGRLLTVVSGMESHRVEVPISDGPRVAVFVLPKSLESLRINSSEEEAAISVDGRSTGVIRNGRRIELLTAGAHKIKVTKPGFSDFEREVKVFKDTPNVLNIELHPA